MLSAFTTKRFMYTVLKTQIDYIETHKEYGAFHHSCIGLLGARRIGKSTILHQLYDSAPDVSCYLNIQNTGEDFDFRSFFEDCISKGIHRIYIDEIGQIKDESRLNSLVSVIKYYAPRLIFVLTGSMKASVAKAHDKIGRGTTFELSAITYAERLAWKNGKDPFDISAWSDLSTNEEFLSYLNYQDLVTDTDKEVYLAYLRQVVRDFADSYIDRYGFWGEVSGETLKDVIEELYLICKDRSNTMLGNTDREILDLRVDYVTLALELEYYHLQMNEACGKYGYGSKETVPELMVKYGLDTRIE